jgi:hypothetical protein
MRTNISKALVAALVLAGVSLSFVSNASAAPTGSWQSQQNYMDRASNGGHAAGDTNGF